MCVKTHLLKFMFPLEHSAINMILWNALMPDLFILGQIYCIENAGPPFFTSCAKYVIVLAR